MASSRNPTAGQTSEDSATPTVESKQTRRTAEIWKHFQIVLVEGAQKAKCNTCGKLLALGGNSTLVRHHQSCAKNQNPESSQAQIGATGQIWTYDQELQRDMQMKCMIQKELPFSHFDDRIMTEYIQRGLQPKYQKVSTRTIRRDALKAYLKSKKDLIKFFSKFEGRVCLTSDIWTSSNRLGVSYICITCHWIDQMTYEMCKRIICFESFEYPHTGIAIYQVIMSCVREFKIKDKIFSISFDNATNNTAAIDFLKRDLNPILNGVFFHTRCVCHILNLVVQDGLKFAEYYISKIKNMILFIYTSKKRRQEFKAFVHAQGVKFLNPELDMPVRWNSTFKMLERAKQQKNLLMEFYGTFMVHDISSDDWIVIEGLLEILRVFYDSTMILSGVYYPTSSRVLPELLTISNMFKNYKQSPFWQPLIFEMQQKFCKYFKDMPPIFSCAAALNPYIGYVGVEAILEDISDNLGIESDNLIRTYSDSFLKLYETYDSFYGIRAREIPDFSHHSSSSSACNTDALLTNTLSRKKTKRSSTLNELGIYQNTDFTSFIPHNEIANLNLLDWWKNNGIRYPVMAALARDLLTVQASTVASESAFSCSGRILNERRSRLNPQSLEICICYKDYLDGMQRQQDTVCIEDSSDEEIILTESETDETESQSEIPQLQN